MLWPAPRPIRLRRVRLPLVDRQHLAVDDQRVAADGRRGRIGAHGRQAELLDLLDKRAGDGAGDRTAVLGRLGVRGRAAERAHQPGPQAAVELHLLRRDREVRDENVVGPGQGRAVVGLLLPDMGRGAGGRDHKQQPRQGLSGHRRRNHPDRSHDVPQEPSRPLIRASRTSSSRSQSAARAGHGDSR